MHRMRKIENLESYLTVLEKYGAVLAYDEVCYASDETEDFNHEAETIIPEEAEIIFSMFEENYEKMGECSYSDFFEITDEENGSPRFTQYTIQRTISGLTLSTVFNKYMTFIEFEKKLITNRDFREEVEQIAEINNLPFIKGYVKEIDKSGEYQKRLVLQTTLEKRRG